MKTTDARNQSEDTSLRRSALSTVIVMVSTFVSRLLGFLRIAVITAIFGGQGQADVINAVFNVPNNLRKLMAEGALSSAFIPELSRTIVQADPSHPERVDRPKRLVRNILTLQVLILVPVLVLSAIFSDQVVGVLLSFDNPELQAQSADLFSWLIQYTLLISISAVLMATLNAHQHFLLPAVTPILLSVSVVTALLVLSPRMGVFAMAVGVLVGGMAQILFQAPKFASLGYSFLPSFRFDTPEFRRVMKNWLPVVATASIFVVNQTIAMRFASGLRPGSSTALANALVFWQLPFGIFGASVTTVLFPRMSRQIAEHDTPGLRESMIYGLRYMIAFLLPSAVLLILLGGPVISVALQRGLYGHRDTLFAAEVLNYYAIGLVSVGAYNFVQRLFYSWGDTRTPLVVTAVIVALDIALSLVLKDVMGPAGLALANSVSFSVGLVALVLVSRKMVGGLNLLHLCVTGLKTIVSVMPAVLWILVLNAMFGNWWHSDSSFVNLGILSLYGFPALGLIGLMFFILRVEVVDIFLRRPKG